MKKLSANHTFIPYGEAVEKILNKSIDKPYISFSSDDGFKNNLLAGEILNNYGAKACFFINPGLIGENNFGRIKSHCRDKLHLQPVEFLNWDDVSHLMEQGHEIGGHTLYHDNMAEMTDSELKDDLTKTYHSINTRCGKAEHFAYPYGRFRHFNEMARKAVFAAGFISCASAERGCHFNDTKMVSNENLCIRRDHVILDWDIGQIMYFIANNVRQRNTDSDVFPYKQL
jgi:peptidoglycan/xylan/chitin deacetylase (PgdA/CDA1 family)